MRTLLETFYVDYSTFMLKLPELLRRTFGCRRARASESERDQAVFVSVANGQAVLEWSGQRWSRERTNSDKGQETR
jgi:hypothetical protein